MRRGIYEQKAISTHTQTHIHTHTHTHKHPSPLVILRQQLHYSLLLILSYTFNTFNKMRDFYLVWTYMA